MANKITNLVEHEFTFPQLDREATPNYQPYLKMSFYFRKRADITHQEFHEHWQTVHADLATSAAPFAQYVTRYTQTHQTPELKEKLQKFGNMQMLDFDGCSEIWVRSYEDGEKFFQSEEYVKAMAGRSRRFLDLLGTTTLISSSYRR
ncbi:hypothetical protein LOCC1_G002240 [Lachnellula occidentalis]|uniref:EthD domain-containing protein n=1 Tax=Lachnellula occidentalis TaxID=215460 RepID=A0A8H8UGT0_9HELO|nr:hypothetical protein LOCC1_G002240 [Lachnellula occidentalis]